VALDYEKLLEEAELAYHKLATGTKAVEFRDSNGETIRYSQTSMADLAKYIQFLKNQLGVGCSGPMTVSF
jgi:hypothetical protein